jgi:polar amino acid transport system substrate-binding protein
MILMPALQHAFDKYGVADRHQREISYYLEVMKIHDAATYKHSLRVGLLAARIAETMGLNAKALLWAGLLHDIGKMLIDVSLLRKTSNFTAEDMSQMKSHVEFGFRILNNAYSYTAAIIVRHHRYSNYPYPEILPALPSYLETRRLEVPDIDRAARILALADYYDALTTRRDKFVTGSKRERFLQDNSDMIEEIKTLEKTGVFKFS